MQPHLKHHLRNPWLWQIALVCYWLALYTVTHIPMQRPELQGGKTDKLVHLAAFAVLGALLAITWQLSAGRLTTRSFFWVWFTVTLYAAFEELTQPLVGRTCSVWDWLADTLGAALGTALGLLLFAWWRPADRSESQR
jgi:VanZ family protein